jgi:hypothetical protein
VELDCAGGLKAHVVIEVDGAAVRGADVQEGGDTFFALMTYDLPDEGCGEALSAMRGMGADAADLGVSVELQALAAHGDQLAGRSNAEVGSHGAGAWAKEAGEGDVGEGDHFTGVGVGEWNNLLGYRGCIGHWDFGGQDHLQAFQSFVG